MPVITAGKADDRCSNSIQSQPSQHRHQEASEEERPGVRGNKNVANEIDLCNTIGTIHKERYRKQMTQKFKTA